MTPLAKSCGYQHPQARANMTPPAKTCGDGRKDRYCRFEDSCHWAGCSGRFSQEPQVALSTKVGARLVPRLLTCYRPGYQRPKVRANMTPPWKTCGYQHPRVRAIGIADPALLALYVAQQCNQEPPLSAGRSRPCRRKHASIASGSCSRTSTGTRVYGGA